MSRGNRSKTTRLLELIGMAEQKKPSKTVLFFSAKHLPKIRKKTIRGEIWNTSPAVGENLQKATSPELALVYELPKTVTIPVQKSNFTKSLPKMTNASRIRT